MSSESMKLDRQKGLEEKRLKLEKLKKEREERQAASLLLAKNSQNIDKENNNAVIQDSVPNQELNENKNNLLLPQNSEITFQEKIKIETSNNDLTEVKKSRSFNLSVNMAVVRVDFHPISNEYYEKSSQTDLSFAAPSELDPEFDSSFGNMGLVGEGNTSSPSKASALARHRRPRLSTGSTTASSNSNMQSLKSPSPSVSPTSKSNRKSASHSLDADAAASDSKDNNPSFDPSSTTMTTHRNLTAEDELKLLDSSDFKEFVMQSGRVMERALGQSSNFDILHSYTSSNKTKRVSDSQILSDKFIFECDEVKGRPVNDIQMSPHTETQAGLFLAAYGPPGQTYLPGGGGGGGGGNMQMGQSFSDSSSDYETSGGLVCLWQSALNANPETRFLASSPVLAAQFHNEDQNLILGACYNGQILLWDLRSPSHLPVQKSSLAGKGHRHPVYSLSLAAASSSASYDLLTVSTDGQLCHWDMQRLSDPISSVYLQPPTTSTSTSTSAAIATSGFASSVNVTCSIVGRDDNSKEAVFGSENGCLYRINLPYRTSDPIRETLAHQGLITSIHRNPGNGKFVKDLFLTSSLDWTVKLWSLHNKGGAEHYSPLLEIVSSSYDYICDVKWSTINPSLFSTITSGGLLSLWDMSKSILEPQDSFHLFKDINSSNISNSHALNKSAWSNDGSQIFVGDTKGSIYQIEVRNTAAKPRPGDESRFEFALMSNNSDTATTTTNTTTLDPNPNESSILTESAS